MTYSGQFNLTYTARELITPLIDTVYPLDDLTLGLDQMERGAQRGKLVIDTTG